MNKLKLIYSIILLNFIFFSSIIAQVKLPAIVSSDMVLQRNTTVNIWGWAAPSEKITIQTSWITDKINVVANNDGTWSVEVKTTDIKAPQSIQINSKSSNIKLENILFGEVWLCSGQSNMQMRLNEPVIGANSAIMYAKNSNLRLFHVEKEASKNPLFDLDKKSVWKEANSESVASFSAVAYFFGKQLQEILDVPVGIIHSSWGGSPVEAWISKEVLSEFQLVDLENADLIAKPNVTPTVLFNGMIHPIIPYKIKGALWYQGEANRRDPENYKKLFPAMVKDWRKKWNIGDFPFYYVQIAPYNYNDNKAKDVDKNSAFMREAQLKCLDLIPNSGIAITLDLGNAFDIHPPNKKEVADRLLMNALNKTYGIKSIKYISPIYKSQEVKENEIILSFKNLESKLFSFEPLKNFEIAGKDKIFYPASAIIVEKNKIVVKSEQVLKPVAVRYAWRNFVKPTLFDGSLLPVSSFRTDEWIDATHVEK